MKAGQHCFGGKGGDLLKDDTLPPNIKSVITGALSPTGLGAVFMNQSQVLVGSCQCCARWIYGTIKQPGWAVCHLPSSNDVSWWCSWWSSSPPRTWSKTASSACSTSCWKTEGSHVSSGSSSSSRSMQVKLNSTSVFCLGFPLFFSNSSLRGVTRMPLPSLSKLFIKCVSLLFPTCASHTSHFNFSLHLKLYSSALVPGILCIA